MLDFKNIDYLKSGNSRQREAYVELKALRIFENLKKYNPILAGTIPIEIDLPESDLDIICECKDHKEFSKNLTLLFKSKNAFEINSQSDKGIKSTVVKFKIEKFEVEIFGQNIPTDQQNAYRHMLIEYKLLQKKGVNFRTKIIDLKLSGYKTEPAFAKLLGLTGNPFEELLKVEI